jgi:hypothetical protein
MFINAPQYKIGNTVVIRRNNGYEMVEITGAFIDAEITRPEWQYYTTSRELENKAFCYIAEHDIIPLNDIYL